MWNTDVVKFMSCTKERFSGIEKATWSLNGLTAICDVQSISNEKVVREYGITDAGNYKKVYDTSLSTYWEEMSQVEFEGDNYLIVQINKWNKMSSSNSIQVLLKKVV